MLKKIINGIKERTLDNMDEKVIKIIEESLEDYCNLCDAYGHVIGQCPILSKIEEIAYREGLQDEPISLIRQALHIVSENSSVNSLLKKIKLENKTIKKKNDDDMEK
jgi:hypothetical protein